MLNRRIKCIILIISLFYVTGVNIIFLLGKEDALTFIKIILIYFIMKNIEIDMLLKKG